MQYWLRGSHGNYRRAPRSHTLDHTSLGEGSEDGGGHHQAQQTVPAVCADKEDKDTSPAPRKTELKKKKCLHSLYFCPRKIKYSLVDISVNHSVMLQMFPMNVEKRDDDFILK